MFDQNEVMDLTQNDGNIDIAGSLATEGKKKGKTDKQAKQQQAEEKAAKKAAEEVNKIYKPGECMKYMNIEVHPVLADAWYMSDVSREAAALGARVLTAPALCDPALLMWSRTVPRRLDAAEGRVGLTPTKQDCGRALFVIPAADVQHDVATHELAKRVGLVKELAGGELTVVIFGVKDFFKSSGRKTSNSSRKLMTEIDLEMAVTDCLVSAGCDVVCVNSAGELALLIAQFTRAIAEAPYKKSKKACEEQVEFYMKGDNKNCVALDKDGHGSARLWQQMLAILPHSSLEISRAICEQYKSPLALHEALCRGGSGALAELPVRRAAAPGARARRLGPDLAAKLHTLFTSERGDVLLD